MRLRIDQADGLAAGLTSGLSSGLVPGLVPGLHAPTNRAAARMSKASNGFMKVLWGFPDTLSRSHRREDPSRISVWAVPGSPRPTEAGARGTARPTLMRALAEMVEQPEPTSASNARNVRVHIRAGVHLGVVTDPDGGLADGFASVQGTKTETFLAPVDALDPLAGFLGAMLGSDQGAALLPWLAGHLGDAHAKTTIGPITVATYTESADDHSKLHVEVANQTYLDASGVEAT